MSRTAAVADVLDARDIWRPKGDGDALRATAATWRELAEVLDEIGTVLDGVARSILDSYRGPAADRFHDAWQRYTGADGYVAKMLGDCRTLAASLDDFGGDVDRADAELVHLVTEVLELQQAAITAGVDPSAYDDWLRHAAGVLAGNLAGDAESRLAALALIEGLPDIDLPATGRALDVDAITWTDPGHPLDLSGIAHTPVDFGAGEGQLNPNLGIDPGTDATAAGGGAGGGADLSSTGGGGGLPSLSGGGGLGGGGRAIDLPPLPELPASTVGDGGLAGLTDSVPVAVPLPDVAAVAGAGLAGAGALAAAATAGKHSGMFPMLPMVAAASGGDEGDEPRRRVLRKRVAAA